jgi:acyl-coenzyme A synthetase/AMP-(fatty) acid ligase
MKIVRDREGMSELRREIMQYVLKGISKFACPKEIKIVHDLPRTPTGKTVRQIIVEKGKHE